MNPLTHALMAQKVKPYLNPQDADAYAWGAVIPDIRYVAKIRRAQTHLPAEDLLKLRAKHPNLSSFLDGYQVHCLLDSIDTTRVVAQAFPLFFFWPILRLRIRPAQMNVLIELYYLQSNPPGFHLLGGHNPILTQLGVTPSQTETYRRILNRYFQNPTIQNAMDAFEQAGMVQDERLEPYRQAYQFLEEHPRLKALLLLGVKNARVDQKAVHEVQTHRALFQPVESRPASRPISSAP